jgi:ACR3 family arsenite efflux pump ArsB
MLQTVMIVVWSVLCIVAGIYIGGNNPKLASKLPGITNRTV